MMIILTVAKHDEYRSTFWYILHSKYAGNTSEVTYFWKKIVSKSISYEHLVYKHGGTWLLRPMQNIQWATNAFTLKIVWTCWFKDSFRSAILAGIKFDKDCAGGLIFHEFLKCTWSCQDCPCAQYMDGWVWTARTVRHKAIQSITLVKANLS